MRTRITITCIGALLLFGSNAFAQQPNPHANGGPGIEFFQTSDQCIGCHSNLHAANGQDISIGYSWRASMMANAARDPYWHAAVRREVMDHPAAQAAIEDKCSTCHMPMHRFTAAQQGRQGEVFANVAALLAEPNAPASDGVSCTVCHQIRSDNFGDPSSFTGGFLIDTATATGQRTIFGPHVVDAGRQRVMQSAAQFLPGDSVHLKESEMCATCHTLYTHALDEAGNEIGELAEQVPYLEWLHSAYRTTNSCQSCHMPELTEEVAISSVLGQPRPQFSQHVFRGGNVFMLGILNRYRGELGVQALPQEFAMTIRRTREYLETSAAKLSIDSARLSGRNLEVDVMVENLAGHKLPTAYPSRRAWLHLKVTDDEGRTMFESGALRADGSIVGNDNDADGSRYEPHYDLIEQAEQVQIYEPILVDSRDRVTTGLLTGVRYIKDNRVLPLGFDKRTAAADIGVFGAAAGDDDFIAGGDRVRYRVPIDGTGPLTVDVRLWYQTIGFRWAENLKRYDAAETNRFTSYYEENAAGSAVQLAAAIAVVER